MYGMERTNKSVEQREFSEYQKAHADRDPWPVDGHIDPRCVTTSFAGEGARSDAGLKADERDGRLDVRSAQLGPTPADPSAIETFEGRRIDLDVGRAERW